MRSAQLKIWLAVAQAEENPDPPRWHIVVDILQLSFGTGYFSKE